MKEDLDRLDELCEVIMSAESVIKSMEEELLQDAKTKGGIIAQLEDMIAAKKREICNNIQNG